MEDNNKIINVTRGANKIFKFCFPKNNNQLENFNDVILEITDGKKVIIKLTGLICLNVKNNYFIKFTLPHTDTIKLNDKSIYDLYLYGIDSNKNKTEFEYYKNKILKIEVKDCIL